MITDFGGVYTFRNDLRALVTSFSPVSTELPIDAHTVPNVGQINYKYYVEGLVWIGLWFVSRRRNPYNNSTWSGWFVVLGCWCAH